MNTPNPKENIAIDQTLSNAYTRMQDMIELGAEIDPNADSALIIPKIRAQLDELTITPRMIESPPLKYILGFRDTVAEILQLTEKSVKDLERLRNYSHSNSNREISIWAGQFNIWIQLLRFDFMLFQMEAMSKYRDSSTLSSLRRHARIAWYFAPHLAATISPTKSLPDTE